MSVFLRWGIFGILGVAGLMYAYNASKHVSERREARVAPPAESQPADSQPESEPEPAPPPVADHPPVPEHCKDEMAVALRAREARNQNEPVDRLMRMPEIVFAEPRRKRRLEDIAKHYFTLEGREPAEREIYVYVMRYCPRKPG